MLRIVSSLINHDTPQYIHLYALIVFNNLKLHTVVCTTNTLVVLIIIVTVLFIVKIENRTNEAKPTVFV